MVQFGYGIVIFGGYLPYRLIIAFVHWWQCYCFGGGCKGFVLQMVLSL